MTLTIPHGHKFACICLKGVLYDYINETQAGPFHLTESLSVHVRPAGSLNSSWLGPLGALKREILGAIHRDQLINSNFVILATAPTKQYDVPNKEDERLIKKTFYAFHAIRMHRAFSYDISIDGKGIILTGVSQDDKLQLRSLRNLPVYYRQPEDSHDSIDQKTIGSAGVVASNLNYIETEDTSFGRLRRGLGAWIRGAREATRNDRLHQFVRTLEAILISGPGKGLKKKFTHRGKIVAVVEDQAKTHLFLKEIWDLRSTTEHLNDWKIALPNIPVNEREGHAFLRAFQVERLASEAYIRLLSNRQMLEHFRDESCMENFWSLMEEEQRRLWGIPIDLTFVKAEGCGAKG